MRLLFITSYRLGDAVLSSGVLAKMIEARPGQRVTVVCGTVAAPLFAGVPGIERVIGFTKKRRGAHWLDLWRSLVLTPWSHVVDLRGSAIAYLLPTRRRTLAGPQPQDCHRVEALGRTLGFDTPPSPHLWTTPAAEARADLLIPEGGPVLGIGPAANWKGKQWRAERFAALANRLTAPDGPLPGARIAVFAAEAERDQAQPMLDALPPGRRLDLVGATDPLEAYACLRRCAAYVGNDSGLMHLAAAAGIPTAGLFGPSRDAHYAPWGPNGLVIRTRESYDEIVNAPSYHYATQETLMDGLDVDRAYAAVNAHLQRLGAHA